MSTPKWFTRMIEKGKAFTTVGYKGKESYVRLENKRGVYKGRPGDWVCKDEYGHVSVTSKGTFPERYEKIAPGVYRLKPKFVFAFQWWGKQ